MTPNQNRALWEMYRQGLHAAADQAEKAWRSGEHYQPDRHTPLAREIAQLIRICNWEVRAEAA